MFRGLGLGFRSLGFRVLGLGFGVGLGWCLGFWVQGSVFRSGFRVRCTFTALAFARYEISVSDIADEAPVILTLMPGCFRALGFRV